MRQVVDVARACFAELVRSVLVYVVQLDVELGLSRLVSAKRTSCDGTPPWLVMSDSALY